MLKIFVLRVFADLVRTVAEAAPGDVVKVITETGILVNPTPDLTQNTPETPYSLRLIATNCQSNFFPIWEGNFLTVYN